MRQALLIPGVLLALVIASAVSVVYCKHESRKLFAQLQQQQSMADELAIEWGRLRLEESSLATHGRIEAKALRQLSMRSPGPETTVIVSK